MRSTKILSAVLVCVAAVFFLIGCKKEAPEVQTSETAAPTAFEEIERKATEAGYSFKRKEEAGIREINEDIDASDTNRMLVNCMTVFSSAEHTGAIVFEFESEEGAADFFDRAEEMLGKLKDGMSKERRGRIFIYGNTSVIEDVW